MSRAKNFLKKIDRIEALILVLVLVPHFYIALHTAGTIIDWFNTDDAFYYFVPARNIAKGAGVTFDGITSTNGFHPLWMAISVPVFVLAQINLILPIRVMILILAILHAATGIVLYRFTKEFLAKEVAILVGLFWVLSPAIHDLTVKGGIESGLNAFFISLFWYRLYRVSKKSHELDSNFRSVVGLGIIAALALFSRLDNVFLISWGGLWLLYRWWQAPNSQSSSPKDIWLWRFRTGLAYSAPATISLLIYTVWNKIALDVYLPISGSLKVWWGTLPFTIYGTSEFKHGSYSALLDHLFSGDKNWGPWSFIMAPINAGATSLSSQIRGLPPLLNTTNLVYILFAFLLIASTILLWVSNKKGFISMYDLGLIPLLFAALSQIGYYNLRMSLAQRSWYWVVEAVFLVLLGAVIIQSVYGIIINIQKIKWVSNQAVTLLLFAAGFWLIILNFNYQQTNLRGSNAFKNHFYIDRAKWLENNTEPNSVIAITGAGALSYFTQDRIIVNMDGLMNNAEYFRHLQRGDGDIYLAILGVDYIFGSRATILGSSPYVQMLIDSTDEVAAYAYGERETVLWRFSP